MAGNSIIYPGAIIRGDLRRTGPGHAVSISIGKYVHVSASTLRPPYKIFKTAFTYFPMKIGDHIIIEEGCVIEAASIGSYCNIGKNVIIGRFAIIKECCIILENTVIPPNAVIPPFSVVGGGSKLIDFPLETLQEIMIRSTKWIYHFGYIENTESSK
jgi:dynactin-5